MPTWHVRFAEARDLDAIVHFNCELARETESLQLDREIVARGVKRGLQQAPEVQYLVALSATEPLGVLMLTREWSDWRDGWLAWLQSVYVTPPHRGQGVFQSLLTHALDELRRDKDVVGVRLYVENENQRALAVYQRSGFRDPNYRVLERMLTE